MAQLTHLTQRMHQKTHQLTLRKPMPNTRNTKKTHQLTLKKPTPITQNTQKTMQTRHFIAELNATQKTRKIVTMSTLLQDAVVKMMSAGRNVPRSSIIAFSLAIRLVKTVLMSKAMRCAMMTACVSRCAHLICSHAIVWWLTRKIVLMLRWRKYTGSMSLIISYTVPKNLSNAIKTRAKTHQSQ